MLTRPLAVKLHKRLGAKAARQYLKQYFANELRPTHPAIRRLQFAQFFFADAFNEKSPDFHVDLYGLYASGKNFAAGAPRGHAKTTTSSTEVIYRIVNNRCHFALVVSDTYSQARDIVDNIKSELESNEWLRYVYGDLRTEHHWTSGAFTTNNDVRVMARGTGMKVRGLKFRHWRPDFVVADDLENDELVANPDRRLKLINWWKKALMPALARKNSQIGIVGTVLHDDSLLNNMLKGEQGFKGWVRKRWSALYTDEQGQEQSLWPAMFSVETLKRMRDDPDFDFYLGALVFAQEMQNEAIDDGARIIKREWIYGTADKPHTYSLAAAVERFKAEQQKTGQQSDDWQGLWLKTTFSQIVMAVDPAISEKTTADFFAMFVLGIDRQGELWMLDVFQDRIDDIGVQVERIIEMAEKWGVHKVKVEAVAYQAGLSRAVQRAAARNNARLPIFAVTPDKDKIRRAIIHSANFSGGLVHLRTDHQLFEGLVKQILDFPLGKHDDMLDAYMHAAEDTVQKIKTRTFARKPQGL